MEKAVVRSGKGKAGFDDRKVPIMRTLAKFHECDTETILSRVDASELDVHDILREMVSKREVESSKVKGKQRFALTLDGWSEYMRVLGSIYELPE